MLDDIDSLIEAPGAVNRPRWHRFQFLYVLLVGVIALLVGRSFYMQVIRGSQWLAMAEGNRVTTIPVTPPRGIFYDHYGTQLVENIASTDAVIDPNVLANPDSETDLIDRLPSYLPMTQEEVADVLHQAKQKKQITIVVKALDHDQVLRLEQAQNQLPGIRLVSSLVRKYPFEQATAHILGYTSPVTETDLQKRADLLPTDITGKTGLERFYDQQLHGQRGNSYVEVNAAGQPQKEVERATPVAGATIQLAVDTELQKYIYQVLSDRAAKATEDHLPPVTGAVIALDPNNGAIRALVSFPSYDPNVFSQPSLRQNAADLFKDKQQPLFNRAADGEYAPGSTIKPILAAAALQEKLITPSTTVLSTGGITVGPWHFPDWKAGGHGITDVKKAIAESVNTFFYIITGGDDTHSGLGVARATKYLAQFGWGKPTGVDLPTEANGFLPSPDWKAKVKGEQWYIGDTYHLGIGQGDVLASPLQVTAGIAAIANGGTWYQPHLVETMQTGTDKPHPIDVTSHTVGIDPDNLSVVRAGMRQTVTDGSGRSLNTLPIPLAGKTGTAQVGGDQPTHAWFTSFGPYDQPKLVVTVLLEKGGAGDADAVPIAKNIWQWWSDHRASQ